MLYNKNDDKRSVTIISPAHNDEVALEVVMHAASNGYWHASYLKVKIQQIKDEDVFN